jgi:hypothetical protein
MKEITLTQGKVALVDDSDYDWVNQWKWTALTSLHTFYAYRWSSGPHTTRTYISMHRLIMGQSDYPHVDHVDGNGLNNQRNNLRWATHKQNAANRRKSKKNTSGFKGVSWRKDSTKWEAGISLKGNYIYLGHHAAAIDAARAYDKAARDLFGEFANLNFPEGIGEHG